MPEIKEGPRSFAYFLSQLGDGDAEEELSEKLHKLNKAIADVADELGTAKGKLVLTVTLEGDKLGRVDVDYDVKIAEPKLKRPRARLWLSKGGNVVFEDPRQQKLPLREVQTGSSIREPAPAETGTKEV